MQFILFLSLARKKKISKRKGPVCTSGTTPDDFQAKGQDSLRSDSQPSIRLKTALRFTPLL